MKKVLIIAPYFTPRRRVGALRPHRFTTYLSKFGWKPSIVCIETTNVTLTPKELEDLKKIEVFALTPPFDKTTGAKQRTKEGATKKDKTGFISSWLDKIFPIDTWLPFFWIKKKEIENIIQEIKPDIIWSTSDPWSGGYIAGKVAKKTGIKWVADFRDPWTLCDVRFPEKGLIAQKIEKKVEGWIAKNTDFMTFTSIATEQLYLDYYPELLGKTATIYNSFTEENYYTNSEGPKRDNKLTLLFLGTFRWLSNANLIIKVLNIIKQKEPDLLKYIEVSSFGGLTGSDLALAKQFEIEGVFTVRKKVPYELVNEEIVKSDILLLSTHPERSEIIPAKLLDYLPSEKPIFSLVQNLEVEEILQKTGRGVQFDKDRLDRAADFLIKCILSKKDSTKLPFVLRRNEKEIMKLSSESTTKKLAKILDKVYEQE